MLNNNHKITDCGFSEALVSYLYDESNDAEKSVCKKHLDNCSACSDEIASFSGVQFSISDWKLKEFSGLVTPLIEIPYENSQKQLIVTSVQSSWLSGLRNLFNLSPAWSLATASVVVLAICIGIVLFAMNSRQTNDIAASNKNQSKPIVSPTVENTNPQNNVNSNQMPDKQTKPVVDPKSPQPEVVTSKNTDSTNSRAVKISNNPRTNQKPEAVRKNNEVKNTNKTTNKNPKIIDDDEEEDNTLRLAELFDEIDTK